MAAAELSKDPSQGRAQKDKEKVYKIRYSLNILPSMNIQCEGDLIEAIVNSEELAIFETDAVTNMVKYKWKAYAFASH